MEDCPPSCCTRMTFFPQTKPFKAMIAKSMSCGFSYLGGRGAALGSLQRRALY